MANPIKRFLHNAPTSQKVALGGIGAVAAAALLVGGAGAAFNSYQDSHAATGNATNDAAVVLELSNDGTTFTQTGVAGDDVTGLESGDSQTTHVWLKNAGVQPITVNQDSLTTTGGAFDGTLGTNPDTATLDQNYVGTAIAPGDTVEVTVTVTVPSGQDQTEYSQASGAWSIAFAAVNSSHYVNAG